MIATANRKQFMELVQTHGRVDRDAGMIYGVKLLGSVSRNGRRYTEDAMRNAVSKYDGVKVYRDHPQKAGETRNFNDWVGIVESPRYQNGALYGDIRLRKAGPDYDAICEAAESFANNFGLSHVADGESRYDGDTEVIESIDQVFSVDIVTDPATAKGLYESFGGYGANDERAQAMQALTDSVHQLIDMLRTTLAALANADGGSQPAATESTSDYSGSVPHDMNYAESWSSSIMRAAVRESQPQSTDMYWLDSPEAFRRHYR